MWDYDSTRPPGQRWRLVDPLTDPVDTLPTAQMPAHQPAPPPATEHGDDPDDDHSAGDADELERVAGTVRVLSRDLDDLLDQAERVRAGLRHLLADALARLEAI